MPIGVIQKIMAQIMWKNLRKCEKEAQLQRYGCVNLEYKSNSLPHLQQRMDIVINERMRVLNPRARNTAATVTLQSSKSNRTTK